MNYPIYAAGKFTETDIPLKVFNPYNNEHIATSYLANQNILERAITKAQEVEETMANLPSHKKYKILMQIANDISSDADRLAKILSMESGKPLRYAKGEIARAVQTFTVAAEESKRIKGEYLSLDWTVPGEGKEGWIKYFPIGLVAGIAPFNFPLNLAVHKIAPAIAAGNPIILKPARSTPLSVLELAKIVDKTDLPKGALAILPMDRDAGNQLVTDDRFKLLSFTGSPQVGWKMKQQAGKKKVLLELGGNAGMIITESCNLELAVKKSFIGGFAYSGQVCIHLQRMYVHESVFETFIKTFVEGTKKINAGNPIEQETEVSVMIDLDNALRVKEWVDEAVKGGAKILCGGNIQNNYFEPTVLTNTKQEMKVCALEVFGPVVTIEKYTVFNDAVSYINNSEYGLQTGVFTNNIDEMNTAFNTLEVGSVIINDIPTFRVDHMPYGGVKNSGLGREGVKYAIEEMMEPKLLVKPKQ